jgi:caffeoyl-CoA O-methyltransferase
MKAHNLFPKEINDYCISCTSKESEIAKKIYETTQELSNAHMLTGSIIGNLLATLVSLSRTQNILEIGAFTGYSAAMMASGLKTGKIITIEEDSNYYQLSIKNLFNLIKENKVQIIHDEGIKWLKEYTGEQFDIIFLDARKETFSNNIDLIYDKLSINGLLIVDNALARGAVLHPLVEWQRLTDIFNKKLVDDLRFRTVLLPIRDGLLIAQKAGERS